MSISGSGKGPAAHASHGAGSSARADNPARGDRPREAGGHAVDRIVDAVGA